MKQDIRRPNAWLLFALAALAWHCAHPDGSALAQHTGGSFGGSSFGGSSSSGSSYSGSSSSGSGGSSSSSSSGSSGWRSSNTYTDNDSSSSGSMRMDPRTSREFLWLAWRMGYPILIALALAGGYAWMRYGSFGGSSRRPEPSANDVLSALSGATSPSLVVISVAVDSSVRAEMQKTLAKLAEFGDTRDFSVAVNMVKQAARMLQRQRASWLYMNLVHTSSNTVRELEEAFREKTSDLRARFKVDAVRNVDGSAALQQSHNTPRPYEGQGVVVVSVVLATKTSFFENNPDVVPDSATHVLKAFDARDALNALAAEVIWSPADDGDRMSTLELEQFYPELVKVTDASVGRVVCPYCKAAFAGELPTCPACGSPRAK